MVTAAVAERRAPSLVSGLTGAVESGLAKLQRVLQGRPDGFPPGVIAAMPAAISKMESEGHSLHCVEFRWRYNGTHCSL